MYLFVNVQLWLNRVRVLLSGVGVVGFANRRQEGQADIL